MCRFRRLHTPRNPRWLCRSALDRAGFPHTMRPAYTRHRKFQLTNSNLQFDRNKCPIESQPILIHMCRFRRLHTPRNPHWWCRSALDRAGFLRRTRQVYTRHRKFRLKNSNLRFDRNKCPIGFQPILKHTRHLRRLRIRRSLCLSCRPELDPVDFLRMMRRVYTQRRKFRLKNSNLRFDHNRCPIESRPILERKCHFRTLRILRNLRWLCRPVSADFPHMMRRVYKLRRKFRLKNSNLQFDRNKCLS